MGRQRSTSRTARSARRTRAITTIAAVAAAVTAVTVAPSVSAPVSARAGVVRSLLDGSDPAQAAASCWEAKQQSPASTDGLYWLRTPSMQRPEQFYCDMTTDGGGWVLVGRGREGWTFREGGQSTPQAIRSTVDGPGAFAPGALSTETIDGLLDGGAVSSLVDGVRVRRATAIAPGSSGWQELRWTFADLSNWSWSFGGGHRLSAFTIGGTGTTGSNSKDSKISVPGETGAGNRGANQLQAWFTYPWAGHGGLAGFSYGGNVNGSNSSTSYLWEYQNEDNAIPFSQVFLRPRITTPALAPIPDTGTIETTRRPMVDDRPQEIAGGVVGVRKVGDSEPQLDTPVLAITTFGDRVYVGGKFDDVRDSATGSLVDQNYLAAFDRDTGAWISSFRPQLDGTVYDLEVADGKLLVAGQFTAVDGQAGTAGLAALDPMSGAVVAGWSASLTVTGTTNRPLARAIDVETVGGVPWVYVGGNFTRITHLVPAGADVERNAGRLARVRLSDGLPDGVFSPDVAGVPYDLDAVGDRVHVVGSFSGMNGTPGRGVATVDSVSGANVAGLAAAQFTTTNPDRQYQQAVLAVGTTVFQGGSEHNTHVYRASDYTLLRSHVAAGNGGDTQAFASIDGIVYQASHGNSWMYSDATTWPGVANYSRVDDYKWVGAFDTDGYGYEQYWVPSMRSAYTEGVWALHADVDGCLWFGGDILGGPFVDGQRQYLESFSKFCQRDVSAPTTPNGTSVSAHSAGGNAIAWNSSTDDRPGYIGYEVLRNDRVVSDLVYGRTWIDTDGRPGDRYFVRAVDSAGNRSASSPVIVRSDNTIPTTPRDLVAVVNGDATVTLTWNASSDDVAVTAYRILRNGVEHAVAPVVDAGSIVTYQVVGLPAGANWLQVQALDAAGNESRRTAPTRVDLAGPDTQRPTQPGSPTAVALAGGVVRVGWTASSDDVAVVGYRVRRNLAIVAETDGASLTADVDLGSGGHYVQIEAFDAAGNVSFRTAPVYVEIAGDDSVAPSTPRDLTGTVGADGAITVTWTASTDDVGVTSYQVLRNGVEVQVVDGQTATARLVGLGVGSHFIQVRARDAAGNESFKTSPIEVVIAPPDTRRPTPPGALSVTVAPDGTVTATWTASTDDVGVASYRVLRNLVEVTSVAGSVLSTPLALGTGDHWIQVQALDAAGNESSRTAPVRVTL